MTPIFSVYVGISLDGFIARADGRIDWLEASHDLAPAGEDFGYTAFMASVDSMLMGRNTFEAVAGFPEWPYGDKPVYVFSNSLTELPATMPPTVSLVRGTLTEVVNMLATHGRQRVYLDGGKTIQSFMQAGLVHDLIITTVPILIGTGLPLFGPLPHDLALHHLGTQVYGGGFVQSKYETRPRSTS